PPVTSSPGGWRSSPCLSSPVVSVSPPSARWRSGASSTALAPSSMSSGARIPFRPSSDTTSSSTRWSSSPLPCNTPSWPSGWSRWPLPDGVTQWWGRRSPPPTLRSDRGDARCRRALRALLGLVAHLGAFGQRPVAVALDRRVVHEQILAVVIGRDEAKALVVAEPLHGTCGHEC